MSYTVSTSPQNHHIVSLKTSDYYFSAYNLNGRPIRAQVLSVILTPVIVQPCGIEAPKVSDGALMFAMLSRYCLVTNYWPTLVVTY